MESQGASQDKPDDLSLGRFRPYLELLARAQVAPGLRDALDVSGVIQQTLLEAHEKRRELKGSEPGQAAAWLRQILAHNLADAFRAMGRAKRDFARQQSLEDALCQSSVRLGTFLASDQSSPSQHLQEDERAVLLAEALAALPDDQREALIMQHWQNCSLAEIGVHLNRTPAAVAGLLKRGLACLREQLRDARERGAL